MNLTVRCPFCHKEEVIDLPRNFSGIIDVYCKRCSRRYPIKGNTIRKEECDE